MGVETIINNVVSVLTTYLTTKTLLSLSSCNKEFRELVLPYLTSVVVEENYKCSVLLLFLEKREKWPEVRLLRFPHKSLFFFVRHQATNHFFQRVLCGERFPAISQLVLSSLFVNRSRFLPVAHSLKTLLTLSHLDLSCNKLRDDGVQELVHTFEYLPNLTFLNLNSNDITCVGASFVLSKVLPTLRILDLSDNFLAGLGEGEVHIVGKKLTKLNLGGCGVGQKGLSLLDTWHSVGCFEGLESLNVAQPFTSEQVSLDDAPFVYPWKAHLLVQFPLKHLKELSLQGLEYGEDLISWLEESCAHMPSLQVLDLSSIFAYRPSAGLVLRLFQQSLSRLPLLTHLNLSYNYLYKEGFRAVLSMCLHVPSLRHLSLRGNRVRENFNRVETFLKRQRHLKVLDIRGNDFTRRESYQTPLGTDVLLF